MTQPKKTFSRAQGTIEYLIIIAIVTVLSLAVVGIILTQTNTTGDISNNSSQINALVGNLAISESVSDIEGDTIITIQNNTSDILTLTKIKTTNQELYYDEVMPPGNNKTFYLTDINTDCQCVGTQNKTCTFQITTTNQYGITKTENKTINLTCTTNLSPANTTTIIGLGAGTLTDPWIINSCEELQDMNNHLDGNYALGGDINCYQTINWNSGAGFAPVGPSGLAPFTGNFDGRGNTISNLFIYTSAITGCGLFAYATSSSSFSNVGLTDVNITGYQYTGALVGTNYGDINKAYSTGHVYGLSGGTGNGGLVGYNKAGSVVSDSYSTVNVSMPSSIGGGLVGWHEGGLITNSYATGTVSVSAMGGGITGMNMATITNSFATGAITEMVGGTCGAIGGWMWDTGGTITNSYWYDNDSDFVTHCYFNGDTGCTKIEDTNGGVSWFYLDTNGPLTSWNFNTTWREVSGSYPVLAWQD